MALQQPAGLTAAAAASAVGTSRLHRVPPRVVVGTDERIVPHPAHRPRIYGGLFLLRPAG
jgi:hypothetical protein